MPIKIVHIASGDSWAGAEVQLFTLAKALHRNPDVSIRVILLNHGELENRLKMLDIPVLVLNEFKISSLNIFWQLIKYLKHWKPDVVHTHRMKENVLGGLAAKIAGNIPSLRTVHGAQENYNGWRKPHKRAMSLLDNFIGKYVQARIIAVSGNLAKVLQNIYPADKIAVIENGIDIKEVTSCMSDDEPNLYRNTKGSFKIGLVGRLVEVKRVDLFIKIAHYIKQNYPNSFLQFYIYGDGPMRAELESLCVKLNVQDIVRFEGHCKNIHKEIASLNALIITSNHEGLPMTLLEAMALDTLVISHSVGGIPDVLEQGNCGYLVNNQDVTEYSSVIMDIVNNQIHIKSVTDLAKQRVNKFYSSQQNGMKFIEQYKGLHKES